MFRQSDHAEAAEGVLREMGVIAISTSVKKGEEVIGVRLDGSCTPEQFPRIMGGEIIYQAQQGATVQVGIPEAQPARELVPIK